MVLTIPPPDVAIAVKGPDGTPGKINPVWWQKLDAIRRAANAVASGGGLAAGATPNAKIDYGAKGDGVANDTDAIAAGLAEHDTIFLPDGIYKVSDAINLGANKTLFGANSATTVLKTTSATANILNVTNLFATVYGLGFASFVPRTAGSFVDVGNAAHRFRMWDFHMNAPHVGISIGAPSDVRIFNGRVFATVVGGNSINVHGGPLALCVGQLLFDNSSTERPNSHFRVTKCGDITLTDCQFLNAEHGCLIEPGTGQEVDSLWMVQCSFDNCGTTGLKIAPTGSGVVNRCMFTRSWAASTHGGNGIYLAAGGSATINGVIFDATEVYFNSVAGIVLDGAGVTNVQFNAAKISGNPIGVYIRDATKIDFNGARIGASGGFGVNAQDVALLGACDEVSFVGNRLDGTVNWTTTGLDINWIGNTGFSGWKAYTPTVTAGTGAFTTVAATGSYLKMGKQVEVRIQVTVTAVGTAATSVVATLPFTAVAGATYTIWPGCETGVSGTMLQGLIGSAATAVTILNHDATFRGASGDTLNVSGMYEIS